MSIPRMSPERREAMTNLIAERLDRPMAALGIIFLLVVFGEGLATRGSGVATALFVAGWVLWLAFVAEFVARFYIAPSKTDFLRKNWWQILLLALPFLRFIRVLRVFRAARAGRVVSSAVRATRSARAALTARLGWLGAATVIVVLTSSQLLFEFGESENYAQALHDAVYAAVVGQPMTDESSFARVLELLLAIYSVVVFATLAGTLGAYFLERRDEEAAAGPPPVSPPSGSASVASPSGGGTPGGATPE